MTWLTRWLDRTEHVKELRAEIGAWTETAEMHCRNEVYYRNLVTQIGEMFGDVAYVSDDGSVQQDVLCAKVPELVANMLAQPDPQQLPYCVKCGQGRKRGEKFTELTFKHDHCPSDDACEVVSAKMPQEQAQ